MPRIGTYTASRIPIESSGASFSLPGERRSPINVPMTDEITWDAVRKAGSEVTDIGARMREARMTQELSEAQVANRRLFIDINAKMQQPEFQSSHSTDQYEEFFNDQADAAWEKYSENIKEARVKQAARKDFDLLQQDYLVKTRAMARNIDISTGRASTADQLRELQEVLLMGDQEGDTRAAADALATAQGIVAGKVNAGFFSPEEGDTILEGFRKSSVGAMWGRRIQDDPAGTWMQLMEAKTIPNLRESEKTYYTKMAQTSYESMLRTQWYLDAKNEAAAGKNLKFRQERTAGDFWERIFDPKAQPLQNELDKALATQDIGLVEYKALSKALQDPETQTRVDDPQVIADIERHLDRGNLEDAREAAYLAIGSGQITVSTGRTYIGGVRSAQTGGISKDYTAANSLLRVTFKQDGIFPDYNLSRRYADATLDIQAAMQQGRNPLAVAVDIYKRERGTVSMDARDWPAGTTVTAESLDKYKTSLEERFKAGEIDKDAYRSRYEMAVQAGNDLAAAEAMEQKINQLKEVISK